MWGAAHLHSLPCKEMVHVVEVLSLGMVVVVVGMFTMAMVDVMIECKTHAMTDVSSVASQLTSADTMTGTTGTGTITTAGRSPTCRTWWGTSWLSWRMVLAVTQGMEGEADISLSFKWKRWQFTFISMLRFIKFTHGLHAWLETFVFVIIYVLFGKTITFIFLKQTYLIRKKEKP